MLGTIACVPDVSVDLSQIDEPQVLAVHSVPAEAAPGDRVAFEALFVDASGPLSPAALEWAFCTARVPLAELGPVARVCLEPDGSKLAPIASGAQRVAGVVPDDACRLFGPDPPPAEAGEPTGRPVDPDVSGGYYQPTRVRALATDDLAFHGVRLTCGLAGADQAQTAEYRTRYQANVEPRIELVDVDSSSPIAIAAGDDVQLRVAWAACPEAPSCGDGWCTLDETAATCAEECVDATGCPGAEAYLRFDPIALELDTRREAISIAWFASAGSFEVARTGRSAGEIEHDSENTWTAPDEPGRVHAWVVVRDDRGGASWISFAFDVE
jgi:hypothetical protein